MSESLHDPIDGLVDDARTHVTRACAAVPPDFAAVLARAQRAATEEDHPVLADSLAQAQRDAADARHDDVVDIRGRVRDDAPGGLDALIGDARASVDRMVAQTRMRAIPPLPVVRPRRRIGVFVAAAGVLAAAAIVLVSARGWGERVEPSDGEAPRDQAFDIDTNPRTGGHAAQREPEPEPRDRVQRAEPAPPIPVVEPTPIVPPTVEASAPRPRVDADRLRTLSDEARAAWRAGDRRGAEAKFLQVIAAGGRSALAELAWGDLFALARQLGDDGRLRKRWQAYLGKFPRGRYADDARAGLCRSADRSEKCWARYLLDFPDGSYRAEASGAVAKDP